MDQNENPFIAPLDQDAASDEQREVDQNENPFSAPSDPDAATAEQFGDSPDEIAREIKGNLVLTANIVFVLSACCAFLGIVYTAGWFYGVSNWQPVAYGWTWFHTIHCFRITYCIAFGLMAWRGWSYAKGLSKSNLKTGKDLSDHVERQTWLWLSIGLMVTLQLIGTGIVFVASISEYGQLPF